MPKNHAAFLLIGSIALLLVAAGAWLLIDDGANRGVAGDQSSKPKMTSPNLAVDAPSIQSDDSLDNQKTLKKIETRTPEQNTQQYERLQPQLQTSSDLKTATREWASSNHWLEEDIYNLPLDDMNELQRLAKSGNVYAKTVLGSKLVRDNGDVDSGLDLLLEAASQGSQFAIWQLRSLYYRGAGPLEADHDAALAWGFVSFMLGNWRAFDPQTGFHVQELDVNQWMMVSVLAANFFAEINARHFERTGENMQIQLRPGFDMPLLDITQTPAIP